MYECLLHACVCTSYMQCLGDPSMALQRGELILEEVVCRCEGGILGKGKLVCGNGEICSGEGGDGCGGSPRTPCCL